MLKQTYKYLNKATYSFNLELVNTYIDVIEENKMLSNNKYDLIDYIKDAIQVLAADNFQINERDLKDVALYYYKDSTEDDIEHFLAQL